MDKRTIFFLKNGINSSNPFEMSHCGEQLNLKFVGKNRQNTIKNVGGNVCLHQSLV